MITLVLGGEKSGKSDHGLRLMRDSARPWRFIATGRARDAAFALRIAEHRRGRPPEITVREVAVELPQALAELKGEGGTVLVDSLDFWLFTLIERREPQGAHLALPDGLIGWSGPSLILVSSEAGLGPVAAHPDTARFVRSLGLLNQAVAHVADRVQFVAAGLPLTLKG